MGARVVVYDTGDKAYWKDNNLHRVDGPAVISASGRKEWWENGKLHRLDGPAIEDPNGTKEWYISGQRHRSMGAAVEYNDGSKEWWLWDKRHREDGPAVIHSDDTQEYWLHGKFLTELEFDQALKDKPNKKDPMSDTVISTHPWVTAYRKTKAAFNLDPKTPIPERYKMYMEAASFNHAAASYAPLTNGEAIKKYTGLAQEFERGVAVLKTKYPHLFQDDLPNKEIIVPFTKQQFAERLVQAALRGYYGGVSYYSVEHGYGKVALEKVMEELDKMMAEIRAVDVNPDLKDLQSKQPFSNTSNVQTIRDPSVEPEITATEHDLPELRPVQDLNSKPFDEMP